MYSLIKKEGLYRSSPSPLKKATLLLLLLLTWQALFARPIRKKEHELFSQEKKLIDLKIDTNITMRGMVLVSLFNKYPPHIIIAVV